MSESASAASLDAYVRDLEQAFDPGRLAPYYPATGDKLAMVTTYFWNVALCKELQLALGAAEVVMRNAIHDTLTTHFAAPNWFDEPHLLQPRETQAINAAKRDIRAARKEVIPGRVVAGVTFGFWTSLLSAIYGESPYGTPLWTPNNAELIRIAFPFLDSAHQNRGYVHRRFNAVRALRNRVGHNEPIWRGVRMQSGKLVALSRLYEATIDAIGWVSPTVRDSITALDRFPAALHHGRRAIEADITRYLGAG